MMLKYLLALAFSVVWLVWWICLIGVGRVNFSIKSLAVLLTGFAVIFAVFAGLSR